jgi:hypothetical protein
MAAPYPQPADREIVMHCKNDILQCNMTVPTWGESFTGEVLAMLTGKSAVFTGANISIDGGWTAQ